MPDLRDLYQEVILDHSRNPHNRRKPASASHEAEGFNPLCGDRVAVFLDVRDGAIRDIAFQGSGCAISTASASMMTETVKGKTVAEAEAVFEEFRALLTGAELANERSARLGKLAVFAGVREFPARIKCATLVWHTLEAALRHRTEPATSE